MFRILIQIRTSAVRLHEHQGLHAHSPWSSDDAVSVAACAVNVSDASVGAPVSVYDVVVGVVYVDAVSDEFANAVSVVTPVGVVVESAHDWSGTRGQK